MQAETTRKLILALNDMDLERGLAHLRKSGAAYEIKTVHGSREVHAFVSTIDGEADGSAMSDAAAIDDALWTIVDRAEEKAEKALAR